jgi:hypothetical protein
MYIYDRKEVKVKKTASSIKKTCDVAYEPFNIEAFSPEVQAYIEYETVIAESKISKWQTFEEMEAARAPKTINLARQNIRVLQAKIEEWERVIGISKRALRIYKRQQSSEIATERGRPARLESRSQVVKKFSQQWVASLMDALEAKGCGAKRGLEMFAPSVTERNWRRWLNGDSIPSYTTFENLLGTRIIHGKYAGEMLCNVPVSPTHNQVSTLLLLL